VLKAGRYEDRILIIFSQAAQKISEVEDLSRMNEKVYKFQFIV
jgi:hypothetical protein